MKLKGQKALVTGGNKGIGKAIALAMAKKGADVFINYHSDEEGAQQTVDEIKALGRQAFAGQADVGKEEEVQSLFKDAIDNLGGLDILVNNAGINGKSPITEMTLDEWRSVIDTNLTSQFLCGREAVKQFLKQEWDEKKSRARGKIMCISSVHDTIPDWVNYAASKGGVKMFIRSLGLELAPKGIRVVGISPGAIQTDINKEEWSKPGSMEEMNKLIPANRIGQPEEIGNLAAWLLSDEADYITATTIYIDGGMTAYPGFSKTEG
ncbi:MAG: SDR family oxidoreductase [Chitinophagaceae bacterium]